MKLIGNVASNTKYNPNEARHPPPANREESERDSELEKFIRCEFGPFRFSPFASCADGTWARVGKYEFKRFMEKPTNASASTLNVPPVRPKSTPAVSMARRSSPLPPIPPRPSSPVYKPAVAVPRPSETYTARMSTAPPPQRHPSALFPPGSTSLVPPAAPTSAPVTHPQPAPQPAVPHHPVWDDMMSLANPVPPQAPLQATTQLTGPNNSVSTLTGGANLYPSTMMPPMSGRSTSLPVLSNVGNNPFPTEGTQTQGMGNPFIQLPAGGYPGQMPVNGTTSFQPSPAMPVQVQPPFGQLSSSPFSQSYTPPSVFPQQQQFVPSSFSQPFVQPSQMSMPMQQPVTGFGQPSPMQGGTNPFGAPTWQQQQATTGQPPYGPWGNM